MWIIYDWAGNEVNTGVTLNRFPTFEDAWEWIYETFPDEECFDDYEVIRSED